MRQLRHMFVIADHVKPGVDFFEILANRLSLAALLHL